MKVDIIFLTMLSIGILISFKASVATNARLLETIWLKEYICFDCIRLVVTQNTVVRGVQTIQNSASSYK